MSDDKRTIGITLEGERILDRLIVAGRFDSEMHAAKFAMAHAVRSAARPGRADGAGTKWNVGSFDSDGSLKSVVEALYPSCEEPYRLIEHLIDRGLALLDDQADPDVHAALFSHQDRHVDG